MSGDPEELIYVDKGNFFPTEYGDIYNNSGSSLRQRTGSGVRRGFQPAYDGIANQTEEEKQRARLEGKVCSMSKYIILGTIVVGLLVIYGAYRYSNQSNATISRLGDGSIVVSKALKIDTVDIQASIARSKKASWKDYTTWKKCLMVDSYRANSEGHYDTLVLSKVKTMEKVHTEYTISWSDMMIINGQMLEKAKDEGPTFIIPSMYMGMENQNSILPEYGLFPCICTLSISHNEQDFDPHITFINLLNPSVSIDEGVPMSSALISISMISEWNTPFWIDFPDRLNLTYQVRDSDSGLLATRKTVLKDPVNIINVINCVHLLQVNKYKYWK